ncbi:hypothetical protein DPV78_010526, partial [Talaromyces pinophilus]
PWGAELALQLDRVFISANPQHVEVFRTIADHEVYRYQVAEIVWDDTQLPHDVKLTGLQSRKASLSLKDSWEFYLQLLEQQDGVISSHADTLSFANELEKFPCLKRITLAHGAHGLLNNPCYASIVRSHMPGCPLQIDFQIPPIMGQEDDKKKWRGFGIILRQLAKQEHYNITEFVMDTKELKTGISCQLFNEWGEDYDNPVTITPAARI